MQSVTAILEADHSELHDLVEDVRTAIAEADMPRCYKATDLLWARLAMHIRAEHLHLFPFVRSVSDIDTTDVLDGLRQDHDMFMVELGRAVRALRPGSDPANDPDTFATVHEIVETVAARLAVHDRIEEEKIYVFADAHSSHDVASLHEKIRQELGNYPPRFGDRQGQPKQ